MHKMSLALAVALLALAGCDDTGNLDMGGGGRGGYGASTQRASYVQHGTIIAVHDVAIDNSRQNQIGGTLVGGLVGGIVGSQFGSGSGKTLMTGAGAVAGGMAGNRLAQQNSTPKYTRQWSVRLDNGDTIDVTQNGGGLYVGQHVRVVRDGNHATIEPS